MSDPAIEAAQRTLQKWTTDGWNASRDFVAVEAAREALAPLRELHTPKGTYGECDHDGMEVTEEDGKHVLIEEIGWTCNLMYFICLECCTEFGDQTEDCVAYHDHGEGRPICATARLIYPSEEL